MRQFRFRKMTDGTVHLNQVHPPASGLSTAKPTEETLLVLTAEEMAAADHVEEPLDPPTSAPSGHADTPSGLSVEPEVMPDPAPVETPVEVAPATAAPVDLTVLDQNINDVESAIADLPEADLVALRAAEVEGKDRKGVLAVIDARLDALKG